MDDLRVVHGDTLLRHQALIEQLLAKVALLEAAIKLNTQSGLKDSKTLGAALVRMNDIEDRLVVLEHTLRNEQAIRMASSPGSGRGSDETGGD